RMLRDRVEQHACALGLPLVLEHRRQTPAFDVEGDAVLLEDRWMRESQDEQRLELAQVDRLDAQGLEQRTRERLGRALVELGRGARHLVLEPDRRMATRVRRPGEGRDDVVDEKVLLGCLRAQGLVLRESRSSGACAERVRSAASFALSYRVREAPI